MILWIMLFVLVVAISFVLAIQSMWDYQEVPVQSKYGLFLVRNSLALTPQVLTSIKEDYLKPGLIISFERLFKGSQSTLVMFSTRELGNAYKNILNLLELEDYSKVDMQVFAWEMAVKKSSPESLSISYFENFPVLSEADQFWWQVVFSSTLQPQIRAVVVSPDSTGREKLAENLQNLATDRLTKIPKAFSNAQLLEFYQKRNFKQTKGQPLKTEEILKLIQI